MDVLVMKIDGIEGEATIEKYEKQILCQSFSHSVHNHLHTDVSNIGRARGRVEHTDFTITKYADKSTPLLNYKCCIGANLGTVTFTVLRAAGNAAHAPQMIYTMENAMVANVAIAGGGSDSPIESISLNYTKIKWEVKVQGQDMTEPGSIASEWDVTVNKGADA